MYSARESGPDPKKKPSPSAVPKQNLLPATTMHGPSSTAIGNAGPVRANKSATSPGAVGKKQRRLDSGRAASARYCLANREKVLAARCLRAAERRARLRDNEDAKECTRAASARYRSRHHPTLALKQRQVHKTAFIQKHGHRAYTERHLAERIPAEPHLNDDHHSEIRPRMTTRAQQLQDWGAAFVAKRKAAIAAAPGPTDPITSAGGSTSYPTRCPSPRSPSPSPEEYAAGTEADDEGDH
ncbi:hypothetical protein K438DRAFT_1749312 [Mycena galopus ATCC 62051]|nr:hypothetical protein K438DRAFT_1749312 [Mycena galopus ATCC 62051]